jgi:23S rRNA (adenine2030-N6)-methyltransferase
MNYRHLYHAGNLCDVVKHLTLTALLLCLRAKDTPFAVIETHAGTGLYDLSAPEAQKTNEAQAGILRVLQSELDFTQPIFQDWLTVLAAHNQDFFDAKQTPYAATLRCYAGSPLLCAGLMRQQDRYSGCELQPDDFLALKRNMRNRLNIQLHQRDGLAALRAFLPPPEKRGLVLIDPPYERADEYELLRQSLVAAHQRWPQGIYALWYPLKDLPTLWTWHEDLAATGIGRQLCLEFTYAPITTGLHGSGMLIINPPWRLLEMLQPIYTQLAAALGLPESAVKISWLTPA